MFLAILLVFFGSLFGQLLFSHMVLEGQKGFYSGGSTWGDLALHLALVNRFAQEFSLPIINPLFSGKNLSYPFLIDFISSFFLRVGFSLQLALIIPALVLLSISVFLFYHLALKLTESKLAAFLAPFLFFFNGSLFGLYFFFSDWQKSSLPFGQFLSQMPKEYAHLGEVNIRFSNIIADYVLPQRPFLLGLPATILVIYLFVSYWQTKNVKNLSLAGTVTGLLPLAHFHSFFTLVLLAPFLAMAEGGKNLKRLLKWFYFFLPALLLSAPQIFFFFPLLKEGGFVRFQFGWMKEQENFFWFWLKNLGIFPLFLGLAFFQSSSFLKRFYLPFLVLFLVPNLIIFQPHDFDNMKIMIYWYLLSCILVGSFLAWFFKKKSILALICFSLLTLTGFLSVWRETTVSWLMFSQEEIVMAEKVKKKTPADSLFLTSDRHNHPISSLSGRKIVMGYRGWLWTHGIDYRQREQEVAKMFAGEANLLKSFGVNYVVIGPSERQNFKVNGDFFKQFPIFYQSQNYKIYQIK
ncbi:hypothetical protein HZB97_02310 [Candidatus Gottesmanbacteria bacterium]|nr:hypothetical protein [Candidatus Gottesmanbacteria bacterium]MBI5465641.1 hypothetical protein [Candidatus Gottesmanbacteria bacterium]